MPASGVIASRVFIIMSDENLHIFAAPHPFSNARHDRAVTAGGNLREILKEVDLELLLNTALDVRLFVNDELVVRDRWGSYVPQPGQSIAVRVLPTGGGDSGKNVLRGVMMIAVLAISIYAPALAGFAYGSLGGTVISTGVGIGGMLAVNALVPPTEEGGLSDQESSGRAAASSYR